MEDRDARSAQASETSCVQLTVEPNALIGAQLGSVRQTGGRRAVFPIGLLLLLAVVGCGPTGPDGEPPSGLGSSGLSGAAPTSCDNGVLLEDHHTFSHIGASVTSRVCKPAGLEVPTVITTDDATGAQVDFGSLLKADTASFHSYYGSMEPSFRAQMEASKNVAQESYVWFHVDESDSPDKEWLVSQPLAADAVDALRESRMRAAATALAAKLQVAGAELTGDLAPPQRYGIPVIRIRAPFDVLDAVGTWPEVWRIERAMLPEDLKPQAETYYYTTNEYFIDGYYGYDGTGVTVSIFEHFVPDSWQNLPGVPTGSCGDQSNPQLFRKCHCPTTEGNANDRAHPRAMMGIVRRSVGMLGMANGATTIMANDAGGCHDYGNDPITSAANWSTTMGARVISFSVCNNVGAGLSPTDMFFDYKASISPFPLIVAAAGNDQLQYVCNKHRNGLTVGGGVESAGTSDRGLVTMDITSFKNTFGNYSYAAQEKPNVVAISQDVSTAGIPSGSSDVTGGSSAATPQVAGMAASLDEANIELRSWPEVLVPGIMVSANEDVDGTILSLHDTVDDKDGSGLINAWNAYLVLRPSSRVHNSSTAFRYGHDYHSIWSGNTPEQSFYAEACHAYVPAGVQVRIGALLQSRPVCPTNPDVTNCSADPYPNFGLYVYDGITLVGAAANSNNNYQYVAFTNGSGAGKDYSIKIFLAYWNGLTSTTFGVAWDTW